MEYPLELNLLQLRRRRLPPLSEEEERDHTLWNAQALLRTGVTTVVDCFSGEPSLPDFGLSVALDAYLESGIRVAMCIRCSDRASFTYQDDEEFLRHVPPAAAELARSKSRPFDARRFFEVCESVARHYDGRDDRVRLGYGPTGEQWCSDTLLDKIRDIADDRGAPVQIHLLESSLQVKAALDRHGSSPVDRLRARDFLGPTISLAHAVWVTRSDIETIRDAGSVLVNNPGSNLRYGSGIAPVSAMRDLGCAVGLGLDGNGFEPVPDMIKEMRLAMLIQRLPGWGHRALSATDVLTMATAGGAGAAAMPLSVGVLETGAAADLVLVDRHRLAMSPYGDSDAGPAELLINAGGADAIDSVIVGGRLVMTSGQEGESEFLALSEHVRESVDRFVPLLEDADAEYRALAPHVDEYYRQVDLSLVGVRPGSRNLSPLD
jgi:cytosine/adenosine deaminase-related metal-dependent hydrolase